MLATNTFQEEEKDFQKKKTIWASLSTALVVGSVLLILILIVIRTPIPPFPEEPGGVSVNFGVDISGEGDIQPMSENPSQQESAPAAAASSNNAPQQEDLLTQENSDAEVVVPKVEDKPKPKTNPNAEYKPNTRPNTNPTNNTKPSTATNNAPPQPKANDDALFKPGAPGANNNSKGDGNKGGPGDQGDPNGDPNSHNYEGGPGDGGGPGGPGGGGGGGFSLKGRSKVALPTADYCNERGKAIIDIKVDRNGSVVSASYHRSGSTVINQCSINNAIAAAKRAKFNRDDKAEEFQFGTITYIFTVK
ncbi:MAG: hypothetical protein U0T75_14460 [Chitinophagales bacterium]